MLKPFTYMNESGKAVCYWLQKENIGVANLLVVVDDLALPLGTIRLRGKGSDAEHNELKNIILQLAETAARVEAHYGCPQDIEWTFTPQGRLVLLQARPLEVRQSAKVYCV